MIIQMTFVEFFAGIGLIRWALEREGWRCLFANDIDESKRITYAANFPAGHYVVGDVGQLDVAQVPSALLATAGFPCTDLSLAGARASGLTHESSASVPYFDTRIWRALLPSAGPTTPFSSSWSIILAARAYPIFNFLCKKVVDAFPVWRMVWRAWS